MEGPVQETNYYRAVLRQRQAFAAAGPAPVPGAGEGESPCQNVDAGLPAHLLGAAKGRRLRTRETHVHQVAEALTNRGTQHGA